jgi:hypothetical protein
MPGTLTSVVPELQPLDEPIFAMLKAFKRKRGA